MGIWAEDKPNSKTILKQKPYWENMTAKPKYKEEYWFIFLCTLPSTWLWSFLEQWQKEYNKN